MRDEPHEQVATDGCARSVGGGGADTADVRPPLQPAQVHPAPAVRAAGAQDAPAPGLPRHRRAFRAGSDKKKRVHIFWQRRVNADDQSTAYWYPSQTNAGAMREDRLVFPIPPGTHWRDVQAVVLPGDAPVSPPEQRPALPGPTKRDPRKSKKASPAPMPMGGFRFVCEGQPERAKAAKTKRQPKPKVKIDP